MAASSGKALTVPDTAYLFSYFTSQNGGLRLAWSADGYTYQPLNSGSAYLVPQVGDKLMRDPSLVLGPDNVFRLVWTSGWYLTQFGYASSTDLKTWSPQQAISIWSGHPDEANVTLTWAPEITYDSAQGRYLIVWASDVKGKYVDAPGDTLNPRLYASTTTDFTTFETPRLFFDPGCDAIDATLFQDGSKYWMCFKGITLQLASSTTLDGTYGDTTPTDSGLNPAGLPAEGPTVAKVGDAWIVYYDAYTKGFYGASRSTDLVNWTDITSQVSMPSGAHHGTVIQVPGSVIRNLLPSMPSGFSATGKYTEVELAWTEAPSASSYTIYRGTQSGGPSTQVASGITTTSYIDTPPLGSTYYYSVSAVISGSESARSNQASARPLATSLRACLHFDESSGATAADATGNGWTGALVNGPLWTAGKSGNAVDLHGTNDYVSLPSGVVSALGSFTVAAWVNLDAATQSSRIFDFGTGTNAYMYLTPNSSEGTVRFAISAGGTSAEQVISGTAALPEGAWTHVAVALSGTVGILYVNGEEVGRNSAMTLRPFSLGTTTQNWIGRSQFSADPFLDGRVDDFRIYAGALTSSQIASVMAPLIPAPPQSVSANSSGGQTSLSWTAVSGASSYTVKRATSSDGPFTSIATGVTSTKYVDASAINGATYYYVISAVNSLDTSSNSAVVSAAANPTDVFLFVYFQGNGETVYGAYSEDGRHFTSLNSGSPIFTPPAWSGQNLARDPSILYRNGKFHMVWTSSGTGNVFGYANSTDLLNWSTPAQIAPFSGEQPNCVTAPEVFYDPVAGNYRVVFTATLNSELNDGDGSHDPSVPTYDQRAYSVTTTNFSSFTPAALLFDQNFSGSDSQLVFDDRYSASTTDDRWVISMVVAGGGNPDVGAQGVRSTFTSQRNLVDAAISSSWSDIRNRATVASQQEGPCLVRHGGEWLLYMDSSAAGHYSLFTSADLATWTDETASLAMPVSHPRHGSVIRVPRTALGNLVAQSAANTWAGLGGSNWSDPTNWASGAAPQPAGVLVFSGSSQTSSTNDFAPDTVISGINFQSGAKRFWLEGERIELNGEVANQSAVLQTLALPVRLVADSINWNTTGDITVAGTMSGAGNLVKTGSGTLRLTASNTNTSDVFLNAGYLEFSTGSLGTGPVVDFKGGGLRWAPGNTEDISSKELRFTSDGALDTGTNTVTLSHGIGAGGTGGLTKSGSGVLVLGAPASYLGKTSITGGTLKCDSSSGTNILPSLTSLTISSGATFDLNGARQTVSYLDGREGSSVQLGTMGTLVIGSGNFSRGFSGVISGSGTVQISGTLCLIGNASLSAGVTLNNRGVLDIINWNGTLPADFVNEGVVIDHTSVQIKQTAISGTDVRVTLMGYAGHSYWLQWTDDLTSGSWNSAPYGLVGGGGLLTLVHAGGASGVAHRFYRVVIQPF